MKIRLGLMMLLLAATPVMAEECAAWTASLEQDEGGEVMMAATCQPAGDGTHDFFIQCGDTGSFLLRYLPHAAVDYPPGGNDNFQARFKFTFDEIVVEKDLVFEAMDGAMAGDAKFSEPMGELMKTSRSMTITDLAGKVPSATFNLKNSKAAIEKVEAACSK